MSTLKNSSEKMKVNVGFKRLSGEIKEMSSDPP